MFRKRRRPTARPLVGGGVMDDRQAISMRRLRRPHCAHGCQKIIAKRLFFDAKKPNGRIHSVIDAYAFFELSLTTLPTDLRKKDYLFNCLEVPFSRYRWRELCQLAAEIPGTILSECKT